MFAIIPAVERAALDNLCQLARLRLDDAETEQFAQKFESLLGFVASMQDYQPRSAEPPLTSAAHLDLRKDNPQAFPWASGTKHSYQVPMIINFEEEG